MKDEQDLIEEQVRYIAELEHALIAAREELEWWIDEHGCCRGHEVEVMGIIESVLGK